MSGIENPASEQAAARAVLVVVPAYDEEATIGATLAAIRTQTTAPMLVVDDGSRDDTAGVAARSGAVVIRHPINLGYGAALQTGYKYALAAGYQAVVQLDADGQHDPAYIAALLGPIFDGTADLVVGSRTLSGHRYPMPLARRIGRYLSAMAIRLSVGRPVTDVTSGYQAMNRRVLAFYASDLFPVDFPDANTLVAVHRAGFAVREVPVRMFPNPVNKSMHAGLGAALYYAFKMTFAILVALLRAVPQEGRRQR